MGLDNGVEITYNIGLLEGEKVTNLSIPYALRENLMSMYVRVRENESLLEAEVVYWRKWWGCRNEVVNYLDRKYNTDKDAYRWKLDTEDCRSSINNLYEFDDPDAWLEDGQSIWDYTDDNIHDQIQGDIQALKNIIALMEAKDPRLVKVEFYDSY
jgi:hypothetical protein